MKQLPFLLIAVLGNALGLALMLETDLGASAWGAAISNMSALLRISEGISVIVVSVFFYLVSVLLNQRFVWKNALYSMAFLLSFGTLLDVFLWLLPDVSVYAIWITIPINILGMLILLFSISLHLHIDIAVHPLDVYLQAMQRRTKRVGLGTYITYLSAFAVALISGLLVGTIQDIGVGTLLIIVFGGTIMKYYDRLFFQSKREVQS